MMLFLYVLCICCSSLIPTSAPLLWALPPHNNLPSAFATCILLVFSSLESAFSDLMLTLMAYTYSHHLLIYLKNLGLHMRENIWYLSFWVTLLNVIISGATPFPVMIPFFPMTEPNPTVCMNHIFLTHSSVGGHLDCFHFLSVVNRAAISMDSACSHWHEFFLT